MGTGSGTIDRRRRARVFARRTGWFLGLLAAVACTPVALPGAVAALGFVAQRVLANALGLAIGISVLALSPLLAFVDLAILMWVTTVTSAFLGRSLLPTSAGSRFAPAARNRPGEHISSSANQEAGCLDHKRAGRRRTGSPATARSARMAGIRVRYAAPTAVRLAWGQPFLGANSGCRIG